MRTQFGRHISDEITHTNPVSDQYLPVNTSGPIRVLFVYDHLGYPGGVSHGPGQYLLNVLPRFDQSKVQSSLCVLRNRHPFAQQLEAVGVKPIFLNRQKWDPQGVTDLIGLIRRQNIEVVHLAGMKAGLVGRLAARATGTRILVHVRDMNPMGTILRFMQQRVAKWTDIALAVSNPVRVFAVDELGISSRLVKVTHNPIVLEKFNSLNVNAKSNLRAEFGITENTQVIGIIGRLSPEKGHKILIQAFPSLLKRCPEAVLLIVGDGPTRSELELLVKNLSLEREIRFTGYRSDIPRVLTAMDVVVMPSIREGFPNAAVEAMTAGIPVVAFRVGGLPEIVINGETGFLVEPNDQNELINALLQLLKDPQLWARQSEICRQQAKRFDVEEHIKFLEDVYANLTRSCRPM